MSPFSPKYAIPPTPPFIHRDLALSRHPDGLFVSPAPLSSPGADGKRRADGVLVSWGVRGGVEAFEGDVEVVCPIGGVLGIVRLWDNAYLLVYLPSTPRPLFKNQDKDKMYEVHTLGNVYAVPVHPDLSSGPLAQIKAIQKSLADKMNGSNTRWSFGLKPSVKEAGELKTMAEDSEWGDSSDDSSDDEDDDDAGGQGAPEADEDPLPPAPSPYRSKRFSWNKFLPNRNRKRGGGGGKDSAATSQSSTSGAGTGASSTATLTDGPKLEDGKVGDKPFPADPPTRRDLETKIIRQITREFSSGAFFYSSDYDLTHSLQAKRRKLSSRQHTSAALSSLLKSGSPISSPKLPVEEIPQEHSRVTDEIIEPDVHLPLWRRTEKRFFWNEHLLKEWIDAGLHGYVQPVMQGWVQSETLDVDGVGVDLTLISRRSRDRAGLRYQRRGIDDEGHVANFVETEMVVRAKVEQKVSMFSFLQIRGSIPLKWSQSPYSMKPPPVLDTPVDQSYSVASLHFNDLKARYGPCTIINLAEQKGKESVVTNGFQELVQNLERDDLEYVPFDFHAKCHGMKWENISQLVEKLDFAKMGYFWSLSNEQLREQDGVYRINCIDCLDRTNVVQSAIARHVLSEMFTQLGVVPTASSIETIFNDVWANNGDMMSLCYAHTSALKGDFVRTGKRDFQGMLNDGISSLSRMFYGAISDFFAQAVISFLLGHRNLGVFSEFLASMESTDVSHLAQMSRIRRAAIETSSARVISEHERRIGGWVLLSPEDRSVTFSPNMEEKILLLTSRAIYVVSFNYSLDKVSEFSRIPLESITALRHGAYIISALQEASRDPKENSGLKITFSTGSDSTRYSTYSIRNKGQPESASVDPLDQTTTAETTEEEFYAFKILPMEFDDKDDETAFNLTHSTKGRQDDDESDEEYESVTPGLGHAANCQEQSAKIVRKIHRQCKRIGRDNVSMETKDVVSLAEAERSTGLLAKMDYAVKRFLWL